MMADTPTHHKLEVKKLNYAIEWQIMYIELSFIYHNVAYVCVCVGVLISYVVYTFCIFFLIVNIVV